MNEFKYQNKDYKIIEALTIGGVNFIICECDKKIFYMKMTQLEVKTVFTPLDNLMKVLDAYQTKNIQNTKKILDYFVGKLNYLIKKRRVRDYDISNIVKDFNSFINKMVIVDNVSNKDLKKIDEFLNKYDKKPLYLKLCNVYGLMLLVSIISIAFFSSNLFNWYGEGKESKETVTDLIASTEIEESDAFEKEEVVAILDEQQEPKEEVDVEEYSYNYWAYSNMTIMSVDFTKLKQVNPDTVGWLYVNNSKINYPIVQSGDNSFYLDHSFDKSYNKAGWVFADYRSNFTNLEKNTVIYGHGRYDKTMFGTLIDTLDSGWYTNPENQVIKVSTPEKNMLWQVVSLYTVPVESYYLTHTFIDDEAYMNFLNTIVGRSIYNFNVGVDTNDHILTLSTCLDNNGNRVVMHAKLIKSEDR